MRNTVLACVMASVCSVGFGQAPKAEAEFEVASIKPSVLSNPNNRERNRRENITVEPGSLIMRNVSMRSALQWAYDIKPYQVSGPGWIDDERYEIIAKASTAAEPRQLRGMLQTLLVKRFRMTVHHETKTLQAYVLVVARTGLKMTEGDPNGQTNIKPDGAKAMVTDVSMDEIIDLLIRGGRQMGLDQPVIDQTGLKGRYSFTLDASGPMQVMSSLRGGQKPDPDEVINVVQDVLQSQLGLRAEQRKAPVDLIVVDRAERVPAEN
jgi:uncharacterized protein (TIGR03435 family)